MELDSDVLEVKHSVPVAMIMVVVVVVEVVELGMTEEALCKVILPQKTTIKSIQNTSI